MCQGDPDNRYEKRRSRPFLLKLTVSPCALGGIAKGSGMIQSQYGNHACLYYDRLPRCQENCFKKLLVKHTNVTFNRVSVDGDTSTNDMCIVMANGLAGNKCIETENENSMILEQALHYVMEELAKMIAADGEGADRLMTCAVSGAKDEATAETLAMSICSSSLVKAAMFGADANWGRVLCAMGYAKASFDPSLVSISFSSKAGEICVCENGKGLLFDEEKAKEILSQEDITIAAELHQGMEKQYAGAVI